MDGQLPLGDDSTEEPDPANPMPTPPPTITDEETATDSAANRFMHLLRHPEEQNGDGEHSHRVRNHFMNDLTRTSNYVPMIDPTEKESPITIWLRKTDALPAKAKPRSIAYWMAKAGEARRG
jgi:hypothetical protein